MVRLHSTRVRLRWLALIVAVAMSAGLLAAFVGTTARAQEEGQSPSGKVVLRIGWMDDVDNLNPFIGWTNNVYEIFANEYLWLVEPDPKTMEPGSNGVAKSWQISDDELTWTFTLNEGMTWHDGTPLTAEDVAFTYNYIIDNEMSAYIAFCDGIDQVNAIDDTIVEFVCSKPKANLLRLMIPVLPKHVWQDVDPEDAASKYANDPPCIGSGPFQVVEWKKGRYLRLKAYDDFYLGRPTIDEIIYIVYKNPDTLVQDIKSGNIDCAYLFPPAQYDSLDKNPDIEAITYAWRNWDYVGFNCYEGPSKGNPVLRDKGFRAALEYAIDRDKIVQVAYAGFAIPGWSFMPPGNWQNPDYHWEPAEGQRRDFDPETAKQMLDRAGYTDSDGDGVREYKGKPITLRLWANTRSPEAQRSGKLITGWWEEIGIDVEHQVVDNGVYFDKIWNYEGDTFTPDFDAYIWQWDGYLDPGQTLDCFTTAQIEGWNEMAWSNPTYDEFDVKQNQAIDLDERATYIKGMQEAMYGDASTIVLTHPLKLQAYRTDVWQGWQRALNGKGPAFNSCTYAWAYMNVQPVVAETAGGSSTGMWIGIAVAVVVVLGVAGWFVVRRRKPKAVDD